MSTAVASEAREQHRVGQTPQPLASSVVVNLVDISENYSPLAAASSHLRHEWQPIETTRSVQRLLDLVERTNLDYITDQKRTRSKHVSADPSNEDADLGTRSCQNPFGSRLIRCIQAVSSSFAPSVVSIQHDAPAHRDTRDAQEHEPFESNDESSRTSQFVRDDDMRQREDAEPHRDGSRQRLHVAEPIVGHCDD